MIIAMTLTMSSFFGVRGGGPGVAEFSHPCQGAVLRWLARMPFAISLTLEKLHGPEYLIPSRFRLLSTVKSCKLCSMHCYRQCRY